MTITFDDLVVGSVERFGRYEVTREEIIEFASKYDPQPFHLTDDAAAKSIFGKLAASGWHTCGMMMNMMVRHWQHMGLDDASLGGAGMDELRWTRAVYAGDILTCEAELLEKIPSASRPDRGRTRTRLTVFNQDNEPVLTVIANGLWRRRAAAGG